MYRMFEKRNYNLNPWLEGLGLMMVGALAGIALRIVFSPAPPWAKGLVGSKEVPLFQQRPGPNCGPTALAMVAGAWGIPLSEEEAAFLAPVTPQGTSFSTLAQAGKWLGLELIGLHLQVADLIKANKPIIAHFPPSHYVVIEHADHQHVTIIDPAFGRRDTWTLNEISQRWEGNCLVMIRKRPSSFVTDWQLAGPYKSLDKSLQIELQTKQAKSSTFQGILNPTFNWHSMKSGNPPFHTRLRINLNEQFGPQEKAIAYARTWVYSPHTRRLQFRLGSDDGITVWLNRKQVLNVDVERPCQLDQELVPVTLQQGWNRILLKITQVKGEWAFVFRLTDKDGHSVPNLRVDSAFNGFGGN